MLEHAEFVLGDAHELGQLIDLHPWAVLVTARHGAPVVSHLPVVRGPRAAELTVLGHLARADADLHELGRHEAVLIVQGPHAYISPSWYQRGPHVPTWNYVVAHLHGRPEELGAQDTLDVLSRTVDHLERGQPQPWNLRQVGDYAHRIAPGVMGFLLRPDRLVGKAKLSQDQAPDEAHRPADALEVTGDATRTGAAMRRVLADCPTPPAVT